jgi:catechol 2,3-dioxygenase-like lactoylglutathione lyase family enzyme
MAITHLRHVGIFSPDLDKQRKFYGTIWGLVQIEEEIDAVYFRGASPEQSSVKPACGRALWPPSYRFWRER